MSKELILDPNDPPHSNTIGLQRAVEWDVYERTDKEPHVILTQMVANLLDELITIGALGPEGIGRILAMSVTDIVDAPLFPHERHSNT